MTPGAIAGNGSATGDVGGAFFSAGRFLLAGSYNAPAPASSLDWLAVRLTNAAIVCHGFEGGRLEPW